jgi:tetratricopeptide (TPR) repeat protein
VLLPTRDPARPVQELLGDVAVYGAAEEIIRPYADGQCLMDPAIVTVDVGFRRPRETALALGIPPNRRRDSLSIATYEKHGDEQTGWRVTVRNIGPRPLRMFVVRRQDKFKVVLTGERAAECGRIALEHLDSGRPQAARQWLEWARAEVPETPFLRLWSYLDRAKEQDLRIMAAALFTEYRPPEAAMSILQQARDKSPSDLVALQIDAALAAGYLRTGRPADALAPLDRLLERYPSEQNLLGKKVQALLEDGQYAQAKQFVADLPETRSNELFRLNLKANIAGLAGDYAEAVEEWTAVLVRKPDDRVVHNNRAWNKLFLDPVPPDVLDEALRATGGGLARTHAELHTLAAAYAETGDTAGAIKVLREAVSGTSEDQLQGADWYIVGRVAEHLGLPSDAQSAYEQVEKERFPGGSAFVLAQRRLKTLAAKPQAP